MLLEEEEEERERENIMNKSKIYFETSKTDMLKEWIYFLGKISEISDKLHYFSMVRLG